MAYVKSLFKHKCILSGSRGQSFGLSLPLLPYFVYCEAKVRLFRCAGLSESICLLVNLMSTQISHGPVIDFLSRKSLNLTCVF